MLSQKIFTNLIDYSNFTTVINKMGKMCWILHLGYRYALMPEVKDDPTPLGRFLSACHTITGDRVVKLAACPFFVLVTSIEKLDQLQ